MCSFHINYFPLVPSRFFYVWLLSCDSPFVWQSYQNEVRLLNDLSHPSIVAHIESFIDANKSNMCIVLSYCEGGDLAQYIKHAQKKNIHLKEEEILLFFTQMCLALNFMHEKNILHRDLKTANIFLKNGLVKLGDFGISKSLNTSKDFASTCIGTPYYMSPELFQNKPYNFKSDVWALGCVIFELMTFKHVFEASSINGLASKVLQGNIPQLPTIYSKQLRYLIKAMLVLDAEKRPSMKDILNTPFLRKYVKQFASIVFSHSSWYRPADLENFKTQLAKLDYADCVPADPRTFYTSNSNSNNSNNNIPISNNASAIPPVTSNNYDRASSVSSSSQTSDVTSASLIFNHPPASAASQKRAQVHQDRDRDREREEMRLRNEKQLRELEKEEKEQAEMRTKLERLKREHEVKYKNARDRRMNAQLNNMQPKSVSHTTQHNTTQHNTLASFFPAKDKQQL